MLRLVRFDFEAGGGESIPAGRLIVALRQEGGGGRLALAASPSLVECFVMLKPATAHTLTRGVVSPDGRGWLDLCDVGGRVEALPWCAASLTWGRGHFVGFERVVTNFGGPLDLCFPTGRVLRLNLVSSEEPAEWLRSFLSPPPLLAPPSPAGEREEDRFPDPVRAQAPPRPWIELSAELYYRAAQTKAQDGFVESKLPAFVGSIQRAHLGLYDRCAAVDGEEERLPSQPPRSAASPKNGTKKREYSCSEDDEDGHRGACE